MSNHHHVLLTDVYGQLPNFVRDLHRMWALALNADQGQWENLWSAEPYHAIERSMLADAIDRVTNIAANPIEAGLVESPEQWPGVMRIPSAPVRESMVPRPTVYFDPNGVYPETATQKSLGTNLVSVLYSDGAFDDLPGILDIDPAPPGHLA